MIGPGLERLDADLRALQVAHDADVPADLLGDLPHARDARRLVGRGAVREVDAEHVGAREDQLLDDGWRRRSLGPSVATIFVRRRTSSRTPSGIRAESVERVRLGKVLI